ncbi:MAG: UDP binding domain-containing protein [Candidatus Andersenbacteria bacterium]
MNPDMALIGAASPEVGERLEHVLHKLYERKDVKFVHTNYINAELIKLCLSTFVTTKITYANMLAAVCDGLPGADSDTVAHALGLDSRISPKVLKGGMPYGGPCFPRDNRALLYVLRQAGVSEQLVAATDRFNEDLLTSFTDTLIHLAGENGIIGVLGLSFKPGTHVVEESASLELANMLASRGQTVVVYDPKAIEAAKPLLHPSIQFASSDIECVTKSAVTILATPWSEFDNLPLRLKESGVDNGVIFDPWRTYEHQDFVSGVKYVPWGRGSMQQVGEIQVSQGVVYG